MSTVKSKGLSCSRLLFQNLDLRQLVEKFSAFYGTGNAISGFITARYGVPTWSQINSFFVPPLYCFKIYFNIVLPSTPKMFIAFVNLIFV
jgi:hypothetical protein